MRIGLVALPLLFGACTSDSTGDDGSGGQPAAGGASAGGMAGAGGSSAGSGGMNAGGAAGAGACSGISFELDLAAAQECNPNLDIDQCAVDPMLTDTCGCPAVVNTMGPAIDDARAAYSDYVAGGCGPMPCGTPCPPTDTPDCEAVDIGAGVCRGF